MEQQIAIEVENFKEEKEKSKPKPKAQLQKLETFETSRKYFALLGTTPSLAEQQSYPFNGTILFGFFLLASAIYCTSVFIVYDAETFAEYTQAVYTDSLATIIVIGLLDFIFKVDTLFELLNGCDKLVNTSEYWLFVLLWELTISSSLLSLLYSNFFSIKIFSIEINFH